MDDMDTPPASDGPAEEAERVFIAEPGTAARLARAGVGVSWRQRGPWVLLAAVALILLGLAMIGVPVWLVAIVALVLFGLVGLTTLLSYRRLIADFRTDFPPGGESATTFGEAAFRYRNARTGDELRYADVGAIAERAGVVLVRPTYGTDFLVFPAELFGPGDVERVRGGMLGAAS